MDEQVTVIVTLVTRVVIKLLSSRVVKLPGPECRVRGNTQVILIRANSKGMRVTRGVAGDRVLLFQPCIDLK